MYKQESDELKRAYKKEKDLRVRARILAVNMVCNEGFKIKETAACLMQYPDWIEMWVQRFKTDALTASWISPDLADRQRFHSKR